MCWGTFCYIPGPKKWDEEARPYMLAWLPSVGAVMGALWALCLLIIEKSALPQMAASAVLVWIPFVISGFMHVDGYMDVNDAVMSRGTLEKKRAILKDSRCGTFAIVSLVFLVLMDFGFMSSAYPDGLDYWQLILIMSVPRSFSGLMMMRLEPMETSQYIRMQKDNKACAFLLIQAAVIIALGLVFGYEAGDIMLTTCMCIIGTLVPIFLARHELQGMNGDIAGYGILWGEMLGFISLAL